MALCHLCGHYISQPTIHDGLCRNCSYRENERKKIALEKNLIDHTPMDDLPLLLGVIGTKQAQEHLEKRIKGI